MYFDDFLTYCSFMQTLIQEQLRRCLQNNEKHRWGFLAGIPNAANVISCAHLCATKDAGRAHKEAAEAVAKGMKEAHKEAAEAVAVSAQAIAVSHKEAAQAIAQGHKDASISLSIAIGLGAVAYGWAAWLGRPRQAPP